MPVRGDGLVDGDGDAEGQQGREGSEKVTYVLHPNCAVEEM